MIRMGKTDPSFGECSYATLLRVGGFVRGTDSARVKHVHPQRGSPLVRACSQLLESGDHPGPVCFDRDSERNLMSRKRRLDKGLLGMNHFHERVSIAFSTI